VLLAQANNKDAPGSFKVSVMLFGPLSKRILVPPMFDDLPLV
jgi:hypothetical protein